MSMTPASGARAQPAVPATVLVTARADGRPRREPCIDSTAGRGVLNEALLPVSLPANALAERRATTEASATGDHCRPAYLSRFCVLLSWGRSPGRVSNA